MATLVFAGTDRKVFTPVSALLGAVSNGPGTSIVLFKKSVLGAMDFWGLTNSGPTVWYQALSQNSTDNLYSDDGRAINTASAAATDDTANWWLHAHDWPSASGTEAFHWRNQTSLGSWTHSNSSTTYAGAQAGPGTSGWLRVGHHGDESTGTKAYAVIAIWNVRFAQSDYDSGTYTKTSDLYNHPAGTPVFLAELTATTLVDLIGGSTYSSANSTGTTLTGGDPDNWTLDGAGPPPVPVITPDYSRFPKPKLRR